MKIKSKLKDAQQYLKDLDLLLKKNTGQGLFVGQDVSSNTPMYLPGFVSNPSGLNEVASMANNKPSLPTFSERQEPEIYQQSEPINNQPLNIENFLNRFEEVYSNQMLPSQNVSQGIMSTRDNGVLQDDGTIIYNDGTSRRGDLNAYSIASSADGGLIYSDGSIRKKLPTGIASLAGDRERILYDDGTARFGRYNFSDQQQPTSDGIKGLISGVFGQDRTITQAYGNYNPSLEPGSGYNLGTDIRTKDLRGSQRQLKLPVASEVIQVYANAQPGSGYAGNMENQGYGNSVLLRLSSGELLRFSHLDTVSNLQPGMRLEAGQVFGTPGSTGNVTGEHSDLEYYNSSGVISDPENFSGFNNPEVLTPEINGQEKPGSIDQSFNQLNLKPNERLQNAPLMSIDSKKPVVNQRSKILGISDEVLPEIKAFDTEFGFTEGLNTPSANQARISAISRQPKQYNPFRQLMGNVTERIGDTLGIPEGSFSETIAGGPTKRTNIALANEIGGDKPDVIPGIRQNILDIKNLGKESGQDLLNKAGEGIKSLSQSGISTLKNVFQPKQDVSKRAIGDVSGTADVQQSNQFSSLMDTASSMSKLAKNDIRDPFFKYGGSETYKNFLKPNAQDVSGGALTLDLFNNEFFKDLGNISNVFGGSKDLGSATEKYVDFEKQKYQPMKKINWEEGYDRDQVDNYNRQVDEYNNSLNNYFNEIRSSTKNSQNIYTPPQTSSTKNIFSQSAPKMSMASAQMSMVKPSFTNANMSVAKPVMSQASRSQMSVARPSVSRPPQQSNKLGGSAPQMSVAPKVTAVTKPAPQMSIAPKMSVAPRSIAGQQSKPSSNIFSKVKSTIKNIFRR